MSTTELATVVAAAVKTISGHTAKVWEGASGEVRVYVRGPYSRKGDGGYIVVSDDGTLDGREVRSDVLRGLVTAGTISASWTSDVSRIEVAS